MSNLIVYYSRPGENWWAGSVRNLPRGNTERAAEIIRDAVGGELFALEPVHPYPEDYRRCCEVAKAELEQGARVPVRALPSTEGVDTVFVGFPNWWGTMPRCVACALEEMDLSGRLVRPFCTNEGSGMGSSEADLAAICRDAGARAGSGLAITGSRVEESRGIIARWAEQDR